MAIKIFDTWQENRPELDQVLKVTEWSANTTTAGLAFAGPIREVIERIVSKSEKNLSLEEVVAIAAPLAYLRSFDNWTKQNTILKEIFIAFSF